MRRFLLSVLPVLLLLAACGSRSPVGPSANVAAGGATIKGSVVGVAATGSPVSAQPASATRATSGESPLSVSVVGTSLSATVSGGQFTIEGVPAGPASLRFSGGGLTPSDVQIDDIEGSETIELTVSLSGSSATLESQRRSLAGGIEIEGRVESLPPTMAAGAFMVAGQTVTTDSTTVFFMNGSSSSFADLQLGVRVHVKGTVSGSSVAAAIVNIQNTNGSLPVNVNGVIQGFTGTVNDFQFTIDGRLVKGTSATTFFGNSHFSDLADGKRAEVKGVQGDGYVAAQRIHVNDDDDDSDDDSDKRLEVEGVVGPISGSGLVLTFTVGTTTVHTSATTEVRRKGDRRDASVLQAGMTVDVVGDVQPDGSIVAIRIQIEGDAPGAAFEIDGTMSGVSGTCPTLTFSVKGYVVKTNASTTFVPSCTALTPGSKVEVTGVVQSDGSVLASEVTK